MKNVQPGFEAYKGNKEDLLSGYQQIIGHMIFNIKLGENFRIKAQVVGGGHTKTAPSSIASPPVVSRESVRTALTIAALNNLDILSCNI